MVYIPCQPCSSFPVLDSSDRCYVWSPTEDVCNFLLCFIPKIPSDADAEATPDTRNDAESKATPDARNDAAVLRSHTEEKVPNAVVVEGNFTILPQVH